MPYVTEIPDSFIDLTETAPVLTLGTNLLLNDIYTSAPYSSYDIAETAPPATLTRGEEVTLVDTNGDPVLAGTYAGSGTITTSTGNVNVLGLATLTITVNPISGHYIVDETGTAHFISDQPLSDERVSVNISGTILGLPVNLLNVEIGDLDTVLPGGTAVLNLVQGVLDTVIVNLSYNPNGTLDVPDDQIFPCFVAGTTILTAQGPMPVESLVPGTLVMTLDSGFRAIRWVGRRRVRLGGASDRVRPIRIRRGALGHGSPDADLFVSPQHRILLRSRIVERMFGVREVLVPAKHLLALPGVEVDRSCDTVDYCHIMTDRHEVILSNGAATETLYAGPEAMRSLGEEARDEILSVFPELESYDPDLARTIPPGRRTRHLLERHSRNHLAVVN